MSSQANLQQKSNRSRSSRRFQPYTTTAEIRKQVKDLHKIDNWHGFLQITEDWGLIIAATTLSLFAWTHQPIWSAAIIYSLTIILIGARQRGLRVNNHQATHNALFKNRTLNYWVTVLFCTWITLESYSGYDKTHNSKDYGHHKNLGTDRDLDHQSVVAQGLYSDQRHTFRIIPYLLTLPLKTVNYWFFLIKSRVFSPHELPQERWMRLLFWILILMGCHCFHAWSILLMYWLVPLLTTANWIGSIVQLAEHYPLMEMGYESELYVSRNRIMHPFWNLVLSNHQEGYHLVHHLFPGLPFWHMKHTHKILMQDPVYADLHQEEGILYLLKQLEITSVNT
jgi:fatty acid desaturase